MTAALSAFVDDAYEETLTLMTELRDYLAAFQADRQAGMDPHARTRVIAEISTITRNLTEAMAWLLLQKAVAADEISDAEAMERSGELMLDEERAETAGFDPQQLPVEMRGYMDRSRRLYDQIMRLRGTADRSVERKAGNA